MTQQVSREQDVVLHCTLVTPLKNERDNVEKLWDAIQGQTVKPDEWIITDNGSTDGTYEWLLEHASYSPFPVLVLSLPGYTIAKMMNTAIRSAQHDIIACCHGGTRIPQDWLENLLNPFREDPTVDVSAGVWEPYGETPFERWVASAMWLDIDSLDEHTYLPATRSMAFKRSAWEKVGGFPEWLPLFGEDTLFDIRLHAARCKFVIARGAKVGWRPKSSLRALFRQYRLYAEANTYMGLLVFKPRLFLRPWIFLFFAIALVLLSKNGLIVFWLFLIAIVADVIRLRLIGFSGSLGLYFVFVWLIPIARQLGFVRGTYRKLRGLVQIPNCDKNAIQYYIGYSKHRIYL